MQGAPVFFAYTASWGEDGPSVWESSTSLARVSQTEQNLVLLFLGSPGFVLCIGSAVQSWLLVNSSGCSGMCSSSVTGWEF